MSAKSYGANFVIKTGVTNTRLARIVFWAATAILATEHGFMAELAFGFKK